MDNITTMQRTDEIGGATFPSARPTRLAAAGGVSGMAQGWTLPVAGPIYIAGQATAAFKDRDVAHPSPGRAPV